MDIITSARGIYLGCSPILGRGVFASDNFTEGDLIEVCPVLIIPAHEVEYLDKTVLYNHYYGWGDAAGIAQGFGSFYNHSYQPNAVYYVKEEEEVVEIRAFRSIDVQEEITINYNRDPLSQKPLWFDVV